jgi:SNF2 family DNA or RNA helicase
MRKGATQIAEEVLQKCANELKTELLPYQRRVLKRLETSPGLVVAHGRGTGKTLTSIAAGEREPGRVEVLVPASLIANYEKEQKKHIKGISKIHPKSFQTAVLRDDFSPANLLIVDEAHRARETATKLHQFLKQYPTKKRMLLTGSPVYNRPSDIAALINLAAGKSIMPIGAEFDKKYIKKPPKGLWGLMPWVEKRPTLRRESELQKFLNQWVDYHQQSGENFPKRTEEYINVEMSPQQSQLHNLAWGKLPFFARLRLQAGLPPNKKDLKALNAFQSQTRQISGSTSKYLPDAPIKITPKLQRALDDLQQKFKTDAQHRAVVYSNYLDTLKEYGQVLEQAGIPYGAYVGNISQKKRKQLVEDYNKGRIKALLLSSAGGEGLDLMGTRQLQVLEPHWNDEKLEQVIGRAIRFGSHSQLPEDQRNVLIQRYLTYPQPNFLERAIKIKPLGVEKVLADVAKDKQRLNESLLQLLPNEK